MDRRTKYLFRVYLFVQLDHFTKIFFLKLMFLNIFYYFNVLILKIKKYYFYIFSNRKIIFNVWIYQKVFDRWVFVAYQRHSPPTKFEKRNQFFSYHISCYLKHHFLSCAHIISNLYHGNSIGYRQIWSNLYYWYHIIYWRWI